MEVKTNVFSKDLLPHYLDDNRQDFNVAMGLIKKPQDFRIERIKHGLANLFVLNHHYLKRKIYIARNVSYALYAGEFYVGVAMFGYPVWRVYPELVPPLSVVQCPELIRLCTLGGLPKNTESYFLSQTIKRMEVDWELEAKTKPVCITSFCDTAFGFNGSIYKATNFDLFRTTSGRPTNPGSSHGKWGKNNYQQKAEKLFYIYWYNDSDKIIYRG